MVPLATVIDDELAAVVELLAGRTWVGLTGAGMSTDSGIPDYRGPGSARATPMQFAEFVSSEASRRRYWARSHQGWRQIGQAEPNAGHHALVQLERAGLIGIVTQNVDGLHTRAGSSPVINLHGAIADVLCLGCGQVTSRLELQDRLSSLNPGSIDRPRTLVGPTSAGPPLEHAELRPDGDAVVDTWESFVLADCLRCGGILKPDVVFFGESVPRSRVEQAYQLVDSAGVLVVLGSSLTVMSGLRFVRHLAKDGRPVVIVNRGDTRGDPLASVKLERGCAEVLQTLMSRLP